MSESLPAQEKPYIDQEYFDDFSKLGAKYRGPMTLLRLSKEERAAKREEFDAAAGQENVDLTPKINLDDLADRESTLLDIKDRLKNDTDLIAPLKKAYLWKVNESIAVTRMMQAAANGEQRRFHWYNLFLYGRPDRNVFEATNSYYKQIALDSLNSDDEVEVELAENVLAELPDTDDVSFADMLPTTDAFRKAQDLNKGFFEHFMQDVEVPDEGFENWRAADPQTRQIMDNAGLEEFNIVDAPASTWGVDYHHREVQRPTTDVPQTKERYIGLVAGHEIGTHLNERLNAIDGEFGIVSNGLDRYLKGSEAKGAFREQIVYENFDDFSETPRFQTLLRRHYAISLGYGSDGEPRDFKSIYRILNAIGTLNEYKKIGDIDSAKEKSATNTWVLLSQRIHRGSDGSPGSVYMKDKVYLEGNLAYWALLEENPELYKYWDHGKVDLTNPRHVSLMIELGIINEDAAQ